LQCIYRICAKAAGCGLSYSLRAPPPLS
jgi:hypothetical protein